MKKEAMMEIATEAIELFNSKMETALSTESIQFEFFTPRSGKRIYDDFCSKYFPHRLNGEYSAPGYFDGIRAEAFYGVPISVIALRTDISAPAWFQRHVVLHELSHLFCTAHEIGGDNFYEKYCEGYAETTEEDGIINAGYAIWREAVADIMADHVDPCYTKRALKDTRRTILDEVDEILPMNPQAKQAVSNIIGLVMMSRERYASKSWDEFERNLCSLELFPYDNLFYLLELVFEKMLMQDYWKIDIDFISELGSIYISLQSEIFISRSFRGG